MTEQQLILSLRAELTRANEQYYQNSRSVMSDQDYDTKLHLLETLEAKHPELADPTSPTHLVGSDLTSNSNLVYHATPMLSIQNTYSISDALSWARDFNGTLFYSVEWKVDGLSLSIDYKNGVASTRGDGEYGQNVTDKLPYIKGIPSISHSRLATLGYTEIRGEVCMTFDDFNRYNSEHPDAPFANPRNGASGLLQKKDPAECGDYLTFIAYWIDADVKLQSASLDTLRGLGFQTPVVATYINVQQLSVTMDNLEYLRESVTYPTDGVVIKLDSKTMWDRVGTTGKYPRWCTAYKFKAENQGTTLRDVEWQVGSTGQLTPVAIFDPIQLAGTTVQRATLNNMDWLSELNPDDVLHIGDTLFVEKGGEIIPKVTNFEPGDNRIRVVTPPSLCPICGGRIEKRGANHYCTNTECEARIKGNMLHFVSKDCMDIKGIGPSVIDELWDLGYRTIPDMYQWAMENRNEAGINGKLSASILSSCSRDFWRILHALHIPGVGKSMSKYLAKTYQRMGTICSLTLEELSSIDGIGEKTASDIYHWTHTPHNIITICQLSAIGVVMESPAASAAQPHPSAPCDSSHVLVTASPQPSLAFGSAHSPSSAPCDSSHVCTKSLSNTNILVSGNFGTPARRSEIEDMVEDSGAHLASGVSASVTYIVIPNDGVEVWKQKAGSKYTKAVKLGILNRIITESQFLALLT